MVSSPRPGTTGSSSRAGPLMDGIYARLDHPVDQGANARDRWLPLLAYWGPLLFGLLLAVLAFRTLKHDLYAGIADQVSPNFLTLGIVAVALAGIWLSPRQFTPASLIFYRTSSLLIGLYLALGSVPMPDDASPQMASWFAYAPWLAVSASVLSIWRPTLAFVPFGVLVMQKSFTAHIWGISVTPTDWAPIVESTSFLLISLAMVVGLRGAMTKLVAIPDLSSDDSRLRLPDALVIVAIGIHFANYFWSGMEKATLDGGPFSWLLENRTDVLLDVANEAGFFTLSYGLPFSGLVHALAMKLVLPINLITISAQLACVLVFWRRSWIAGLTLLYDLQHITIFLLTGIFFWKWIIFNLALVAAISRIDREKIPLGVGILGLTACLGAGQLFFVANLGWYDTRSFNYFHVLALTDDGREIAVPTNFFGPMSVTMAQMDSAYDWPDAFRTGTWGTTSHYDKRQAGMTCTLPPDRAAAPTKSPVAAMIPRWHAVMLRKAGDDGHFAYDIYPHHIWSDPRRFQEFAALDLRRITAYRLVRETKCLDGGNEFGGPRLVTRVETLVPAGQITAASPAVAPPSVTGSTR